MKRSIVIVMERREKTMKQWIIVLAIMILVCGTTDVYAKTDENVSVQTVDAKKTVELSIASGKAKVTCQVIGSTDISKIVIDMYLQKKNSNGKWTEHQSWHGTKNSNIYVMNNTSTISKGTYRIKVKVTCYKDEDSQTTYHYTSTKTY